MIVFFKDGSSLGLRLAPDVLFDMYQVAKKGLVTVFIHPPVNGSLTRNLKDIDEERTFSSVIVANFPSLPPDVPRDTEPGVIHDSGDEDEWAWETRPPRSSTMPCRE